MTSPGKTDENRPGLPFPCFRFAQINNGNAGHTGILIRKCFVTILSGNLGLDFEMKVKTEGGKGKIRGSGIRIQRRITEEEPGDRLMDREEGRTASSPYWDTGENARKTLSADWADKPGGYGASISEKESAPIGFGALPVLVLHRAGEGAEAPSILPFREEFLTSA
ncbi:MAG: hypothetical protein SOT69_03280 [Mesosutterella sp.]|nr:hypothetical protein [Mesosutterella sp.]